MSVAKRLLDAVVDVFDIRGRRQRREDELRRQQALADAAKHEALQDLLEAVLSRVQDGHRGQSEALIEVAKGVQENAKALNRWMGLFEQSQADGYTHTVRPAQEVEEHEKRERERLKALGYPVDDPPDVQMQILQDMVSQAFGQRLS